MKSVSPVVAFLVFAASASAKTQLFVSGASALGASAATVVDVRGAKEDAAWARATTYVPTGYTLNLGQTEGTQIGTVTARGVLLELSPDTLVDISGTIVAADRNDPALQTGAMQCTGTATHAAIWTLHLIVSGATVDLPVYVDNTSGAEAAFSSAKLVLCLPQPYSKALPNYSPLGAKIIEAKSTLGAGVLTNPPTAGRLVWRTVIAPWATTGVASNVAGAFEVQAVVGVPASLSLKAKRVADSVLLSGRLLQGPQGVGGVEVTLTAGGKPLGTAKSSKQGAFAKRVVLKRRTTFRARATVPTRDGSCTNPLGAVLAPGGCVSATITGFSLVSAPVTVASKK